MGAKGTVLLFIATLTALAPANAAAPEGPAWRKLEERDGIYVYGRDVAGSSLLAMRGDCVVDAPILRVASVLVDTARAHEWIDSVAETRTLRKLSDSEYVEWNHVATPFIVADRDFVFASKLQLFPSDKRLLLAYHSVTDALAPKTHFVRGEFVYGKFELKSIEGGRKTSVVAELLCDPKGSIAKWMVNMVQKEWPRSTLTRLRRQVAKPDVGDDARLQAELARQGY